MLLFPQTVSAFFEQALIWPRRFAF